MPGENGNGRSLLDDIRDLYADETPDSLLYVPIRGKVQGKLVVAYAEQDWVETQESRKNWRGSNDPRAELYMEAEILAKSVRDIWRRDDTHGQVLRNTGVDEPLEGKYLPGLGEGKGAMNFHSAALALGLPVGDDPLAAVFAVLRRDWEVEAHHTMLASFEPGDLPLDQQEAVQEKSVPAEPIAT